MSRDGPTVGAVAAIPVRVTVLPVPLEDTAEEVGEATLLVVTGEELCAGDEVATLLEEDTEEAACRHWE